MINVIPFHIVHQANSLSDSSIFKVENGPIFETLDGDYYSEISNLESGRVEVGSISYQAPPFYPEEGRTTEATAQYIPPRNTYDTGFIYKYWARNCSSKCNKKQSCHTPVEENYI